MASIAIQCPLKVAPSRVWLIERALPYLAFVPFGYFVYAHLVGSIKKKVVLDAKTGRIKQTFIMNWLKQVGVDRVVLRDLSVRYKALSVLDRASFSQQFHTACLSMVQKVVNTPEFTEAGKASMYDISAIVVLSEAKTPVSMGNALSQGSMPRLVDTSLKTPHAQRTTKFLGFF